MKARTFLVGVVAIAATLFMAGGAALWGLTANSPLGLLQGSGQTAPQAIQFIPRQAPLVISLLVRPDRLWDLRQVLASPERRFQSRQDWQALQSWFQQLTGVDYLRDLQPWLGDEITLAVTTADGDRDPENGQQPGYLLVLTSRAHTPAREAIHGFWQQRALGGDELVFEPDAGLTLIYTQDTRAGADALATPAFTTLASTVVGDRYILIANSAQVLRQAIATFQAPDVSLAQAPTYRHLLETLPPNPIGWLYSTVPTTVEWLQTSPPLSPATPDTALERIFVSWRIHRGELVAETVFTPFPGETFPVVTSPAPPWNSALDWLPAHSALAVGGVDLPRLWAGVSHGVGGYGLTQFLTSPLGRLALGTDPSSPDQTVALWSQGNGPYALGWLPDQDDWIFVTQRPIAVNANAAHTSAANPNPPRVTPLDAFAQAQGWGVGRLTLDDQVVTVWTQLTVDRSSALEPSRRNLPQVNTQVMAVHTPVAGYELFATSLAGLQAALQAPTTGSVLTAVGARSLAQSPAPEEMLYLDWAQLRPYAVRQWPGLGLLDQLARPVTPYLGPLVLTGYGEGDRRHRGQLTIALTNP